MWKWDQSAGILYRDGNIVCRGYSGLGTDKNKPDSQDKTGVGPIPRGMWKIEGIYHSSKTGPFTIQLNPDKDTNTCGRSEFRIHGDSIKNPGTASHGCIILPRAIRELIWNSKDRDLEVVE